MHARLNTLLIYTIILVEGFVTVSVQILSIRQLMPFVGNSVTVTSLIIGIFLLFLAQGYQKGGKVNKHYIEKLIINFLLAGIIIGIGFSYMFIEHYFTFMSMLLGKNLLLTLTIYLLIIIAPAVYLLGQTVPITMHLKNNGDSAGLVGGKVLHLSTIGSFLGAVLTSLICMQFFGVAQTIFLNYMLLFTLILVLLFKNSHKIHWFVVSAIMAVPIYFVNVDVERNHFVRTTEYANYQVVPSNHLGNSSGRILSINRSSSSYVDDAGKVFPYVAHIEKIIQDIGGEPKDILVLGAGGFALGHQDKVNHYTYVDIDKKLPQIVKENFLDKINGEVVIEDARKYLLTANKKFDIIVIDVYSHALAIPTHLTTQAFHQLVQGHLHSDGVAIYNLIISPWLSTEYAQHTDNTIKSVFNYCSTTPIDYTEPRSNMIYACKMIPHKSNKIYIDNFNNNDFEMYYN